MVWQSGDSLNPTNMNNQTVSNLTVTGTLSYGSLVATSDLQGSRITVMESGLSGTYTGSWASTDAQGGYLASRFADNASTNPVGWFFYSEQSSGGANFPAGMANLYQYNAADNHTGTIYPLTHSFEHVGAGDVSIVEALNISTGLATTSSGDVTTMRALKVGSPYELGSGSVGTFEAVKVSDLDSGDYILRASGGRTQIGDIPSGATVGGPLCFGVGMYSTATVSGWSNHHGAVVAHTGDTQSGGVTAFEAWAMQNSASNTTQNRVQGLISGVENYGASWLSEAYAFTAIAGTQAGGGHIHDVFQYWATTPYILNGGSIGTAVGLKVDNITGATNNFAIKTATGSVSFGDVTSITTSTAATSGNPTGLKVTQTQTRASSGGPVVGGFYLTSTHTTGDLVSAYGIDVGVNHADSGVISTLYGAEIWGGVDTGGGIVEDLRMLYIQGAYDVPGSNITTVYGIKIDDQTAAQTNNYAIHTGKGIVRIGDALSLTSATNFPSFVSGTGFLYADSASSLYYVNGSGVTTLLA